VFTGEPDEENAAIADLNAREMLTVVPLLALSLLLGVYPKPVLERIEPSLRVNIEHIEARTDYREPTTPEVVVGEPGGSPPIVEEEQP